jgi:aryl-phospho-beta-D-glucosidase BglC (GH1 family)
VAFTLLLAIQTTLGCSSSDGSPAVGSGGVNAGGSGTGSSAGTGATSAAGTGAAPNLGGTGGTGDGAGGAPGSGGADPGAGGAIGNGGAISGAGGIADTSGPVKVDTTAGRWRTALDTTTGRFHFVSPDGAPSVLHGISMTGLETGTRETGAGAGFWLYLSNTSQEPENAPTVLSNVVGTVVDSWKANVVRLPICGSAWAQNYQVHDWGNSAIATYKDWVDDAVQAARKRGAVVIIDNHLWSIGKMGNGGGVDRGTFTSNGQVQKYSDYEDGCTGVNKVGSTDSCAPRDWVTDNPSVWQCAIANADGVSLHNGYKNKDNIATMWSDIANRYKGDSGVWFEVFNEPYVRKATKPFPAEGTNEDDADYPWDLWTEYMSTQIKAIRDVAQAPNVVLVNGLDWGYDFGPMNGPIANPGKYLPWKATYANIAYAFHPYQHGACCGDVGASGTDMSATDPYESAFCSYYKDGTTWGAASGAALPGGKSCTNPGYAATQDKKMPPCTWVATGYNPKTNSSGLCAGDRAICNPKTEAECKAVDWASPDAGGWSRYALPMSKYGPLIATEFGSFDCSSAFTKTLLQYMSKFGISYTAWALWPQNSGGPPGLGSCGYPAVMAPSPDPGDFRQCFDAAACTTMMKPLPWSGAAIYQDLQSH